MKIPALGRTSPRVTAWLFALVFFGWLAFVFVPWPRSKVPEPPAPAPVDVRAPYRAKLLAVGLPDNPDLDGLPEIFAVWADEANWKNNRTKFAYWNPGAQDYTYFFEANRDSGVVRFRAIAKPLEYDVEFSPHDSAPEEHPLRFIHFPVGKRSSVPVQPAGASQPHQAPVPRITVDLPAPRFEPAAPELHLEDAAKTKPGK